MYIYNIGYGAHFESESVQMWYEKKLSKRQLEQIVQISTVKALEYAVNHAEDFFSPQDVRINFRDLFERVIIELEGLGFKTVKFTAKFEIDGWNSIVSVEERPERFEIGPVLNRLRKSVPRALIDKILLASQKIVE